MGGLILLVFPHMYYHVPIGPATCIAAFSFIFMYYGAMYINV